MPRVPLLPTPFLEPRHDEIAAFARKELAAPLTRIDDEFAAGRLDEDAAARAAVKAMAGTRLLHEAVLGEARSLCVARREVAWISGFADTMLALQGLGSCPLRIAGTQEQKRRWLEPAAFGALIPAFALTEPEAGSDARHLRTVARRDGDGYVLDGEKTLITNAGIADYYCLFARMADDGRHVAFVIEPGMPGLTVAQRYRALAPHPIGRIELRGCRVPASQRIGAEGGGLDLALSTLDRFRASVGAAALGLALRALGESRSHLKSRKQFGKALADFQLLKAQLADGFVALELAHLAVLRAAWLTDRADGAAEGSDAQAADRKAAAAASSLAKLEATEAAQVIVDRAVQFHGGQGVMHGSVVERLYREVRALRIYEGTSEIQRLILARELLQGSLAGEG
ncbi:MAG: acyl-CoA dehydrogenase [Planctomycetes bacterium]|nr:acyl-CoA dehydrogenase [Planctomycetota bacterium]